jgi:hydroxymethylbilane synthase
MSGVIRIGTRGSKLALWQANTVARLITESGGGDCEIVVIRTSGDEGSQPPDPPNTPRSMAGGGGSPAAPPNVKRMFVKEIEEALLDGRVDLAVHSSKDLPGELPDGLVLAAALEREDPRDAMLLPSGHSARGFDAVKAAIGAQPRIGTSSVRRVAQLRALFPGATFEAIRGNVDTRLRKLDAGECDAIVLAAAGLKRLGLENRITAMIPTDVCLPAPGQGIVAVEVRADARGLREVLQRISDADAETALVAERAVVNALGGGCQMPLGALAHVEGQSLTMHGLVASLDGRSIIRAVVQGNRGGAASAGDKLAAQLLAKGAGALLNDAS